MTKAEIIQEIAKSTHLERILVENVIEAFMENVKNSLASGENVYLRGFGTFLIKHRAEKVARNISKNAAILIPAHSIPAFKPTKEFMNKVQEQVKE